jgi:hypothetical protein
MKVARSLLFGFALSTAGYGSWHIWQMSIPSLKIKKQFFGFTHNTTAVISRTYSLPTLINIIPTSTMPTKPEETDTKKTTETTEEKKPGEYHNFLIVDHSLRPDGFHLCGGTEAEQASK